jgi:3,4-dihydroxyphenylacetate 2,3-dioxygenase
MSTNQIFGLIAPHVPTLLENEMDQIYSPTIEALQRCGKKYRSAGVELVIAVSTHWQTETFMIDASSQHRTIYDYWGFRRMVEYDVKGDPTVASLLKEEGDRSLIYPSTGKHGSDHAVSIPLHFMFPDRNIRVVPLSVAASPLCAFRWGRAVGRVLRSLKQPILFMASGSFSHDLHAWMRQSNDPGYEVFDRKTLHYLMEGKGMDILTFNQKELQFAKPEGYFRDFMMLLGVMGSRSAGELISYESFPGVGMGVVDFSHSIGYDGDMIMEEKLHEVMR